MALNWKRLGLDIREKFFTVKVVRHRQLWMPLPWKCSRLGWVGL